MTKSFYNVHRHSLHTNALDIAYLRKIFRLDKIKTVNCDKKLGIESQKEVLVSPETKRPILWPFQLQRLKNEWHVRIDHSEELRKEAAKEKYSRTREK